MKHYLYREYSDEEIDEILNSISSKLNKINNKYNVNTYESMLEFYEYLTSLKRQRVIENSIRDKISKTSETIETDPVLKEYEKLMLEELKNVEEENDNIEEESDEEINFSDEDDIWYFCLFDLLFLTCYIILIMTQRLEMEEQENQLYIQYTNTFKAIKIYEKSLILSEFNVVSDMWIDYDEILQEEIDREIDLVLIKLQFFFEMCLRNSLIFRKSNDWAFETFIDRENCKPKISNNIVLTPGDPGDDHLTLLLQSKFDAIGNEKIFFTSLTIRNKKTNNIKFTFVGEGKKVLPKMNDWIGSNSYHDEPWWCRNDLSTMDLPKVDLVEKPFYDLTFESIVFNDIFEKFNNGNVNLENLESKIIRPKFNPKIIKNEE